MRRPLFAVTVRAVLSSLLMLAAASPAWGAIDPAPSAQESGGWIAILAIIVLTIGVGVGSFMSPRRSHLD